MFPTFGLSHIQLTVADLERSFRFYHEMLGMEELFRAGPHAVMIRTPGSHEIFTLNANPKAGLPRGELGGVAHFGFRLRERVDMKELLAAAERAGGTPLDHGVRGDGEDAWAFAKDPDGYLIEFFYEVEGPSPMPAIG